MPNSKNIEQMMIDSGRYSVSEIENYRKVTDNANRLIAERNRQRIKYKEVLRIEFIDHPLSDELIHDLLIFAHDFYHCKPELLDVITPNHRVVKPASKAELRKQLGIFIKKAKELEELRSNLPMDFVVDTSLEYLREEDNYDDMRIISLISDAEKTLKRHEPQRLEGDVKALSAKQEKQYQSIRWIAFCCERHDVGLGTKFRRMTEVLIGESRPSYLNKVLANKTIRSTHVIMRSSLSKLLK